MSDIARDMLRLNLYAATKFDIATALQAGATEIQRLRLAMEYAIEQCRNSGRGNGIVDERIVERVEETLLDALGTEIQRTRKALHFPEGGNVDRSDKPVRV
jgi:hypothetical protein